MTARERVMAAIGGGIPDRKPVMAWPYGNDRSDFRCFADDTMPDRIIPDDRVSLVEVVNPFGLALRKRIDINQILKDDPRRGDETLGELEFETRHAIDLAFNVGADGILYRLYGARAAHCTPMQYGGHYLERDRELLHYAGRANANVLFVAGEDDVYLDFVSDLPAHAFGWDSKSSRIPVRDVRQMRSGALISEDADSDILLEPGTANLSRILETSVRTEDSYAI